MPRKYLARVQTLPPEDAYIMRNIDQDGWQPVLINKPVYMCCICNQVWALKHHAESCDARDHASTVEQEYAATDVTIGETITKVTYSAIRREQNPPPLRPRPYAKRTHQSYRLDPEDVVVMVRDSGGYRPEATRKAVYMCGSCGAVWALRHLADSCEPRGHPDTIAVEHHLGRAGLDPIVTTYTYRPIRHIEPLRSPRSQST